jgi:hypothetical protein
MESEEACAAAPARAQRIAMAWWFRVSQVVHYQTSKPLAFVELHPYNPLTGIMIGRALLIDSPQIPVHRRVHRKDLKKKIVEADRRKMIHLSRYIASSYRMHADRVQAFTVQARRRSLLPIGLDVDSSSPRI